jgi:chromate transport protein ChrA
VAWSDRRHVAGAILPSARQAVWFPRLLPEIAIVIGFPLLLIPFAVYFILAFVMPGVEWTTVLAEVPMMSGATWRVSFSDALLCAALLLLFIEILKATRPANRSIVDNLLSTLIFIGGMIAFLMLPQAATSTFALLVVIAFVDVIGGWSVSVRTASRDFSVERISD